MVGRVQRQDELPEIRRLYEAGLSLAQIGQRLGYHKTTIKRRLDHAGVRLRAPGYHKRTD